MTSYPNAIIVKDASEWNKVCETLYKEDTIVYDRVTAMSSEPSETIKLYEQYLECEINLVFLKDPYFNTDTYRKAMETTLSDNSSKADIVKKAHINLISEQIRISIDNQINKT